MTVLPKVPPKVREIYRKLRTLNLHKTSGKHEITHCKRYNFDDVVILFYLEYGKITFSYWCFNLWYCFHYC